MQKFAEAVIHTHPWFAHDCQIIQIVLHPQEIHDNTCFKFNCQLVTCRRKVLSPLASPTLFVKDKTTGEAASAAAHAQELR